MRVKPDDIESRNQEHTTHINTGCAGDHNYYCLRKLIIVGLKYVGTRLDIIN